MYGTQYNNQKTQKTEKGLSLFPFPEIIRLISGCVNRKFFWYLVSSKENHTTKENGTLILACDWGQPKNRHPTAAFGTNELTRLTQTTTIHLHPSENIRQITRDHGRGPRERTSRERTTTHERELSPCSGVISCLQIIPLPSNYPVAH